MHKYVVGGEVCRKHEVQHKVCSNEGCTNNALKGGVCKAWNYAAVMDVQIMSSVEECAPGMGQRGNDAAVKDALIL